MKAFPNQVECIDNVTYREVMKGGMDLRDYFAAQAMVISANYWLKGDHAFDINEEGLQYVAETAYDLADAMIKERENTNG